MPGMGMAPAEKNGPAWRSAGLWRLLNHKRLLPFVVGGAVVCAVIILYISQPLFLRQLDNRIYDAFLLARPKVEPSPVPVIIDIDEEALARYGQWPWPRYRMARLIEAAVQRGAAAVALDILLSEPDRSSPGNMREYLNAELGLDVNFQGLPAELEDYDRLLAERIRDYPVVLGMYASFGRAAESKAGGAALPASTGSGTLSDSPDSSDLPNISDASDLASLPVSSALPILPRPVANIEQSRPGDLPAASFVHKAAGATAPLEILHQAAPVGLINMSPDSDGFVRQVPMLTLINDAQAGGTKTYVNLALRALMLAMGRNNIFFVSGPDGLESLRVGEYLIPVSPQGNFMVPFTGPRGEYPYISAARLLDGELPPDAFAGKILFVGASAPGLLDIRATPFDRVYPGVEVHAAVLDAVLSGRFIIVPSWTPGLQVLCILFAGGLAGLAFCRARPRVYVPAGVLLPGGVIYGSWLFFEAGLFVSPLYPVLAVLAQGIVLLMLRFWLEERQKLVLRQAFSRYVAPEVVRRITERQGDFFAGEERELSIMFTDIRGFTSISEKLDPRQVVSLLNRYFTPMTALVRNNGGTLDKFIGDALMAFWNAPLPVENHHRLAVKTALAMQDELALLNDSLEQDFNCRINMGVGIHTGKVYVGNMGSADLVNYTLIGDNVNLASRVEGLCAQFGVHTVVSTETMRGCLEVSAEAENVDPGVEANLSTPGCLTAHGSGYDPERGPEHGLKQGTEQNLDMCIYNGMGNDMVFVPLDTLRVKGREQPVAVFTVLRRAEYAERADELKVYLAARKLYRHGDFVLAAQAFSRLAQGCPEQKTYAVYFDRAQQLQLAPPAAWDGVWTMDSK